MMTRRDFEKFAAVFADHLGSMERVGLDGTEQYLVKDFLAGVALDIADVCESCNIRFIGPSSRAMNALEDKAVSRVLAKKAGVPTPPVR